MMIGLGLLQDELLSRLLGQLCSLSSLSAICVAGAGRAGSVVEDGALDSSHEPRHGWRTRRVDVEGVEDVAHVL